MGKPRLQPPHYSPIDLVEACLRRFIAYPSEHALAAHTLWCVHTHLMDCWETTPRLAFMSAEKESGKTRALEVTALLVKEPIMSISASPAVIIRLIAKGKPTILYDEIDAVFGNVAAQEANGDLRSVLNGGYRRGAKVHRCVVKDKKIGIEALDAFAAVAVAGLRRLPDTLTSRAILIHMMRRAPGEAVTPFRHRYHVDEAKPIREALEEWCEEHEGNLTGAEPEMPAGIEDRSADVWQPLIAIADEAGGDWPDRARAAAIHLTRYAKAEAQTMGVELLTHIREAFGEDDRLWTEKLLKRLWDRDESPWLEINHGKPLNDRGLAIRLKPYGIRSKSVRIGDLHRKGYLAEDFFDAWARYCPSDERDKRDSGTSEQNQMDFVPDVPADPDEVENAKRDKRDILSNENNYVPDVPLVPANEGVAPAGSEISDDAAVAREERAAILEYDAGLDRQEAEKVAAAELGWPEMPPHLVRGK